MSPRPLAGDVATPAEVADALGITSAALTQMRYRKTGPPYTSIGYRIRYRWSEVEQYLADRTVQPIAKPSDIPLRQ
jgi:hypothetical protein